MDLSRHEPKVHPDIPLRLIQHRGRDANGKEICWPAWLILWERAGEIGRVSMDPGKPIRFHARLTESEKHLVETGVAQLLGFEDVRSTSVTWESDDGGDDTDQPG